MKQIKNLLFRFLVKTLSKKNIVTEPKEIKLREKKCIGYSITTSLKNNKKQKDIPPFYHEIYDNKKLNKLLIDKELNMYCIFDFHQNKEDFDYYVAVENKLSIQGEEYAEITLPAGKYIQVELLKRNQKAVGMVVMYIREIWIEKNGYKERNAPPYILYDSRFHSNYQKHGCKGANYLGNPIAVLHIPVEN